jgi:hypothetical protein
MNLRQCPHLFPVFVRSPLRPLLCSLRLCGTTLLTAAPARGQTFYRPLTFEQNRGQAPKEVKWLGQMSLGQSYHFVTKEPLVHFPAPG